MEDVVDSVLCPPLSEFFSSTQHNHHNSLWHQKWQQKFFYWIYFGRFKHLRTQIEIIEKNKNTPIQKVQSSFKNQLAYNLEALKEQVWNTAAFFHVSKRRIFCELDRVKCVGFAFSWSHMLKKIRSFSMIQEVLSSVSFSTWYKQGLLHPFHFSVTKY